MTTKLILVGGFLGSGKTTLLWEAAQRLCMQGKSVGLITNDQAPDLVDTAFLSRSGASVKEVAGSCFCCNFDGLLGAARSLMAQNADVIIAEPVGSCTDLSATIIQPLKARHPEIGLAPLTVLADPDRVREVLEEKDVLMHPSARYILRLQMAEADRILLSKIDTLDVSERRLMNGMLRKAFPEAEVGEISTLKNEGIDEWLGAVLRDDTAGKRIVDVDYDRYAEGEAVLGWLNAVVNLEAADRAAEWRKYARDILAQLHDTFRQVRAEIGHVKLVISFNGESCIANLTRLGGSVEVHGGESLMGTQANLILNARVQMSSEELEKVVRSAFDNSCCGDISATIQTLRCLTPGRPDPTHRYANTV